MNISKRGIVSALLIFLALVLGTTTQTGFSLGDKIFWGLGIPPMTNGQTGFHYTFVIFFIIFLIGLMEAKRVMSGRQLVILLVFLLLITPSVLSFIEPFYFRMHSGLAAVEYDSRNTHFGIRSSEDKRSLEIIGAVALTNYGSETLKLGIQIPTEGYFEQKGFSSDLILTGINSSSEFILHPGQKQTILTYTTIPLKNDYHGQVSMSGPNLILLTDNETRSVGYNQ